MASDGTKKNGFETRAANCGVKMGKIKVEYTIALLTMVKAAAEARATFGYSPDLSKMARG